MRTVLAERLGDPAALRLVEREARQPASNEVLIAVKAVGVAFVDTLILSGGYQGSIALPYIPGTECSGIVEAAGSEIDHVNPGDRVFAITSGGGGFAERLTVDGAGVTRAPGGLPFDLLAIFGGSYLTAYHAIVHRANARAGEVMMVRGAAGALGIAAIQVGRALGLEVYAAASTPEKRAYAVQAGAVSAIDSHPLGWRDRAAQAVGEGRAIEILFDPVGGDAAASAFRALGWGGRHLVLGFAAGTIPELPFNIALLKGAALVGVDAAQFLRREPAAARRALDALAAMLGAGSLAPVVSQRFRLDEFAAALAVAKTGKSLGRVVLEI